MNDFDAVLIIYLFITLLLRVGLSFIFVIASIEKSLLAIFLATRDWKLNG